MRFLKLISRASLMSVLCAGLYGAPASAQIGPPPGGSSAPAEQAYVTPVGTERLNPYSAQHNFGVLPDGRPWGSVSALHVAADGENIWVAERCGANSCIGSDVDPIVLMSPNGEVLKAFGGGLFGWPHGMDVDGEGNIWLADGRAATPEELIKFPSNKNRGHTVRKFSPEGVLLMTLGTPGQAGDSQDTHGELLFEPNDVILAPNGNIYVAEGHRAQFVDDLYTDDPNAFSRISIFAPNGEYVKSFGQFGYVHGALRTPHALAMDSAGRLFVADRGNRRIQIFTPDGDYIDSWYNFSRVSGLYITDNDTLYAIDSESSERRNPGWSKGLRIGSAKTGQVQYFIPPRINDANPNLITMGEGVTVDTQGNIYAGDVGPVGVRGMSKFVRVSGE